MMNMTEEIAKQDDLNLFSHPAHRNLRKWQSCVILAVGPMNNHMPHGN